MSADLKLGGNHDLDLCRLTLADGAQRVQQQIKVTLLTFLGEWFGSDTRQSERCSGCGIGIGHAPADGCTGQAVGNTGQSADE